MHLQALHMMQPSMKLSLWQGCRRPRGASQGNPFIRVLSQCATLRLILILILILMLFLKLNLNLNLNLILILRAPASSSVGTASQDSANIKGLPRTQPAWGAWGGADGSLYPQPRAHSMQEACQPTGEHAA